MKIKTCIRGITYSLIALFIINSSLSIVRAEGPTQGKIVIEKRTNESTVPSSSIDRVDRLDKPIVKIGRLPQTGELVRPFLLILGGGFITLALLGYFISRSSKESTD